LLRETAVRVSVLFIYNNPRPIVAHELLVVSLTLLEEYIVFVGARGRVVGSGTMLQVGRSRVRFPIMSLNFLIDLILPAAYGPGVDSAS
jgi:hypothetical protein